MSTSENMTTPPAKQFASSLFQQAIGSLPVAIALAIGSTWVCYAILPQGVADTYVPQIWLACLGGGFISTAASAIRLPERGIKLTEHKLEVQKVVAAAIGAPDAPAAAPVAGSGETAAPLQLVDAPDGEDFN